MGTTSEELKKLYYKLGGEDVNVSKASTPGEIINAINELDLASAYELPAVTSTDNGKALGVVEGKWNKMSIPKELPAVSGADNGKCLGVSEGKWEAMTIPKELPAVTGDDNGQILGVVEGEWSKMTAPKELPAFDPVEDEGKVLGIKDGVLAWVSLTPETPDDNEPQESEPAAEG